MATKNIVPNADSEGGIGTSSKYWATGFIDAITTTGNLVIGGSIDLEGAIDVNGTTNLDIVDIDGAVNIGAEVTLAAANKIIFNDASQFIHASSNAILNLGATDEIDLTATAIDVNGTMDVSGNATFTSNIGIGDPSPSQKLVVQGDWNQSANNNNQMYIQGSTNSNMQLRLGYDTTGDHGYIQALLNGTGGKELHLNTSGGAVVIANSGTIGCVSDTDLLTLSSGVLEVSGSLQSTNTNLITKAQVTTGFDSTSFLRLHPSATTNTNGYTNMIFGTDTANNYGVAIGGLRTGSDGTPSFSIRTLNDSVTGAEVLNISNTGNATFGHPTAGTNLEFNLDAIAGKANRIQFKESGTNRWLLGQGAASETTAFELYNSAGGMALSVNRSTNAATFIDNIVIGTAGKGIDFSNETPSGSGSANTILDDYEEGTFTAALTAGTDGDAITLTAGGVDACTYTKIGRVVNISGFFSVAGVSSPSGRLRITGLPITQTSDGVPVGVAYINASNSYTGFGIMLGDQGTGVFIDRNAVNGATAAIDLAGAMKAGTEVYFNLTYTTNT